MERTLVGFVPTGKKPCPYGLRDREGNCVPSSPINQPTREKETKNEFPQFAPLEVDPHLTIPVRVPAPKTRKILKTPEGFAEKRHALSRAKPLDRAAVSRLPERVRTPVSNMNAGDEVYTSGKRSREKIVSPDEGKFKGASKAVAKSTLKVRAGLSVPAVLDVGVNILEHIDQGKTFWEAVSQIPGEYFDAFKGLAEEVYDAVLDKDLIRLGEVVVETVNPTTPVIRAIDYAGTKLGAGPIATDVGTQLAEAIPPTMPGTVPTSGIVADGVEAFGNALIDTISWIGSKLPKLW